MVDTYRVHTCVALPTFLFNIVAESLDTETLEPRLTPFFFLQGISLFCPSYVRTFFSRFYCSFYSRKKKVSGYSGTINRKFKCLEPPFQTSETRSASKEDTESAVASAHSWMSTKELISALRKYGGMGKFGARAEQRNVLHTVVVLQEK